VEQSDGDLPVAFLRTSFYVTDRWHAAMDDRYNHAPNDSPRSGSSKKVTPVVWGVIVVVIVALAIWFTMKA
jgi:hypothetical protein